MSDSGGVKPLPLQARGGPWSTCQKQMEKHCPSSCFSVPLEPFAGHRWTRQTSLTWVLEISLQDSPVSYPGDREHSREKQGHSGPYGVKACLGHSHVRKPENWGEGGVGGAGGETASMESDWRGELVAEQSYPS